MQISYYFMNRAKLSSFIFKTISKKEFIDIQPLILNSVSKEIQ